MIDLYKKTEEFIKDVFTRAGKQNGITHLVRTADWVKKLKPNASEALLIAAVAHDVERAFRKPGYEEFYEISKDGFAAEEHLKHHQERGAEIIGKFLEEQDVDSKLIEEVQNLVVKHEIGGNEDENLLKDADSISFFENNIEYFIVNLVPKVGVEKVEDKFNWMFNRISSAEAKEIVYPWYKDAIKRLKV